MSHEMIYDYDPKRKYPHSFRATKVEMGINKFLIRLAMIEKIQNLKDYKVVRRWISNGMTEFLPAYQYIVYFKHDADASFFRLTYANDRLFWNVQYGDKNWWKPIKDMRGAILP